MSDEAYPTSKQPARQLSSMSTEEKERYDAALKSRQEEAQRESIGSIKRRYGLGSREIVNPLLVPWGEKTSLASDLNVPKIQTSTATNRMSTELAERMKQFHSAPPGPLKDYFASEIKDLQDKTESSTTSINSEGIEFSALDRQLFDP